ncbi:unnamed protein product [Calicophoron daubneyi]|uniref:Uncharacterized protein n=1 Tax=Calicophoron daubneyi TaxID=300641 RepID=A0AAV2TCH4_CALDB
MMQELVLKLGSQLHYFCMMGDVDNVLKCLKGRDDNLFTMDDCNYWTPAHWAANYDKSECLALLKSYDAVDTPSFRSMAIPLHIACERGNYNCVRVLLGPNCKLNSQDYQGDTPLHKAAAGGHLNCIQLLILAGAQINVQNFSNRTPTEVAAMAGHFEVASTLNEITAHQNQQNSISTRDPNKDNHCAAPLCRTSVGNCFKRQNAPDFDDPLDKRRKYNVFVGAL